MSDSTKAFEVRITLWENQICIIFFALRTLRVDSHDTTRHDMTRHDTTQHDKIFFYGFHMLEFTLVRHRQLMTKTVALGSREENILPLC
jgi:hypothetical protein